MDYVDSETPPSSPIIGLKTIAGRGLEDAELSFECKGPIRANDVSFSPQGLITRGDLIHTIKLLNNNSSFGERFETEDEEYKFFNFTFQPTTETFRTFIQMCRKNIATLENLAQPVSAHTSSDENTQLKPSDLRKDVGQFLNFVLNHYNSFRQLDEEFVTLFKGMRLSIEKIESWTSVLKSHGGSQEGNKCPTAYYHLFHLHLELRWFFLILDGLNPTTIDWILDDLIYLAWFSYSCEKSEWKSKVSQKNAFNCYCVKELWTMIMHVLNEIKPQMKDFWGFLTISLRRFEKNKGDPFFLLWLIVKVAPCEKYSLTGQFFASTSLNFTAPDDPSSRYHIVRELFIECLQNKEKGAASKSEIIDLISKLLPSWGCDEKLVQIVWNIWIGQINKNVGVQDFNYSKSPITWLSLVKVLSDCEYKDLSSTATSVGVNIDNILANDEFFQVIRLICGHVRYFKDNKLLKFVSPIYLKLPTDKIYTFNEIGLIRLSTLHLGILCAARDDEVLAVYKRCNSYFIDIYEGLSQKNKMTSAKIIFTAQLTMILLLLDKSINIEVIIEPFMEKQIKQLMLKVSTIQIANKKDFIMAYIETLDSLKKIGCTQDLGQASFFSHHISIWLSNAGPDYINRTLRAFHNILLWLLDTNCHQLGQSALVFARKILESSKQFLVESICKIQSKTSTSIEPLADLAADFTYLERNDKVLVDEFFTQFALEVRTCPEISQFYVDKVLNFDLENAQRIEVDDLKLLQAWIRLVCVGASVPQKLTICVLDAADDYVGKSNNSLLTLFCKSASDNKDWDRKVIESILQPFIKLCEKNWNPQKDSVSVIKSVLQSAGTILVKLKLQKLYVPKWPCVAQTILKFMTDYLMAMPALLESCLVEYLPKIFDAITFTANWNNDPYLRSQAHTLLTFAFTSFSRDDLLKNVQNHPAVKILQSATENYNDVVLSQFLPEMKSIVSDQKLTNHSQYLKTLSLFARKNLGLIFIIAKSLPMILKITRLASNSSNDVNMCCDLICSLFDPDSRLDPMYASVSFEAQLEMAFRNEMEQNLSLHSKKYFSLCKRLFMHKNPFRERVCRFLKEKLLVIMMEQIKLCEVKRGNGHDYSLRTQYQTLEADLSRLV